MGLCLTTARPARATAWFRDSRAAPVWCLHDVVDMRTRVFLIVVILGLFLTWPKTIRAQGDASDPPAVAFVEAMGGWGAQLGETDYLPDGSPTTYQHPLVTGWSAGATAGWLLADDLALIGSYQYRTASSREGRIPGVLDRVQGTIHYHTLAIGARMYRALGPGRLRSELAVGLALPFETRLEYEYGPGLAPAGLRGIGTLTDEYNLGYGVQGQLGYELPVARSAYGDLYVAFALELRAFQSNNRGRSTRLDHFVTDFAATPPVAITATTENDDGMTRPRTYAVADLAPRLAIGARF
jgi:hypothetical protein